MRQLLHYPEEERARDVYLRKERAGKQKAAADDEAGGRVVALQQTITAMKATQSADHRYR